MTKSLSGAGFDIDLLKGQMAENDVRRMLLSPLIEVKHDCQAPYTGNVFIELRQPDRHNGGMKKSGILASEADWWAFRLGMSGDVVIFVRRQRLRDLIASLGLRTVMGGDFDSYEGVLVPLTELVGVAT